MIHGMSVVPAWVRDERLTPEAISRYCANVQAVENECWEWKGARNERGYGRPWAKGGRVYAHRVAGILAGLLCGLSETNGEDCALHSCDHPWCVNPSHLFRGTRQDNVADQVAKGRVSKHCRNPNRGGENNAMAKLNLLSVASIRRRAASGESQASLSREYGVTAQAIGAIVRMERWK